MVEGAEKCPHDVTTELSVVRTDPELALYPVAPLRSGSGFAGQNRGATIGL